MNLGSAPTQRTNHGNGLDVRATKLRAYEGL
jgi:hypothetical protein